jgi:hypothetical protein
MDGQTEGNTARTGTSVFAEMGEANRPMQLTWFYHLVI